jgi:hypothetical protein
MQLLSRRSVALAAVSIAALQGCGGGSSEDSPAPPPANYARLVDYQVTPTTMRAPANTAEIQPFKLAYNVDFRSDTTLPTYRLTTHILPAGQALVSADRATGRIHFQNCGQGGNACGNPHEKTCDMQSGWVTAAQRHVRCDSSNLGQELNPGTYQFVANVCEITISAVTNCTTKTVLVTLQ